MWQATDASRPTLPPESRFRAAFRRYGAAKYCDAAGARGMRGARGGSGGSFRAPVGAIRASGGAESPGVGAKSANAATFFPQVAAGKRRRRHFMRRACRSMRRQRCLFRQRCRFFGLASSLVGLAGALFALREPPRAPRAALAGPCVAHFSSPDASEVGSEAKPG